MGSRDQSQDQSNPARSNPAQARRKDQPRAIGQPALVIDRATYAYPQAHQPAHQPSEPVLRSLSLAVEPGQRLALLGPTGCGKSTLLEAIVGLKPLQSGQITIGSLVVDPHEPTTIAQVRRHVGLCFQSADEQLFMPTVLDDVVFGPRNYGVSPHQAAAQARVLLDRFGLAAYADRSSWELSGGQKRLAALAATLALEPAILLLDEPTTGLDPRWRRSLAEILRSLPIQALIVATHDLQWIRHVCDRAVILRDGAIQADRSTADLLADPALLDRYDLPIGY